MKKFILLTVVFFAGAKIIYGQAGRLDASFGNNGIAATDFGFKYGYDYVAQAGQVLPNPDGTMYVVVQGDFFSCIEKRLRDGSPDLSYGHAGISDPIAIMGAALLQPDGKVLVAGYIGLSQNNRTIARYTADGKFDSSFGMNGRKDIDYIPSALAIQSDGKILAAGGPLGIERFNTDGSIDPTFVMQGAPPLNTTAIAVQNDGRVVVMGFVGTNPNVDFAVARFNSNGTADTTFGNHGSQTTDFSNADDFPFALAIQNDGKILLGGYSTTAGAIVFGLARYNTNGTLDSSFSDDGKQQTDLKPFGIVTGVIYSIAVQPDGKIVATGGFDSFFAVRYNSNGSLDKTFSDDGFQNTDFGMPASSASVSLQNDGKIVVAGRVDNGHLFALARYNKDGSLDNNFDADGKLTEGLDFRQGFTVYNATAVQNDGKIVAAGYTWNGANYDFALTRYNVNGILDNTFDGDGRQTADLGFQDYVTSIAIQPDGKIVIAGYSQNNEVINYVLTRYNGDGSPDKTFNGEGKQNSDFPVTALTIQKDGKIVTGGSLNKDFTLARYNTDGSRDSTFSGDGLQTTDFGKEESLASLAIQGDGKIVALGTTGKPGRGGTRSNFALARYNSDGSLDNTFSGDGKEIPKDTDQSSSANTLAIESDGKLLVGGTSFGYISLSRYNIDGSLDATFPGGGFPASDIGTITSIALQTDGKIIAFMGGSQVRRFNTDGNPDKSFGSDGIQTVARAGLLSGTVNAITVSNNKLYASGFGQFPGYEGVVESYLLDNETHTPPTVSLTSPADSAKYLSGGNVYLKAVAADADGTISKVEFYNGSTLLYTATDTPYTFKWAHVLKGSYILTAKATDNSGLVSISDAIHISVVPNKPPSVNIVSPANNQTFLKGATIHLQAVASDADGRVGKVEFYNGTILLTTESKIPYTFDWKVGKTGNYTVTAKATDNWGAVTTSAEIHFSVVPNQPPAVDIIMPSTGQIFTSPATINFEAAAMDVDGRIAQVAFYNGTTLLTDEHKVPYTYQWQNVPAGTYTITAVARDNWGAETTSAPLTVTVVLAGKPSGLKNLSFADTGMPRDNKVSLQLSPNPVHNILNISASVFNADKNKIISVISSSGIVLKTTRVSGLGQTIKLDVSSLAPGMYIIKMISGNKVIYKQFVKM